MRRREFITLLGGAAALPLAARAQQPAMPLIGFLDPRTLDVVATRLRGLRQGLKESGYVDGENVGIAYGWAEDHNDRWPALAVDLVRRRCDRHIGSSVFIRGKGRDHDNPDRLFG